VCVCVRDEQLERYRTDVDSVVLLVSMRSGGGAAGLTLTMATYGFILEPSMNVHSSHTHTHIREHIHT